MGIFSRADVLINEGAEMAVANGCFGLQASAGGVVFPLKSRKRKAPTVCKADEGEEATENDGIAVDGSPGSAERIAALREFYASREGDEVSPIVWTDAELADRLREEMLSDDGKQATPMLQYLRTMVLDSMS